MKRKKYFHFAAGRVIASLLIGAVLYTAVTMHLSSVYQSSLVTGFNDRVELYKKIITNYDEGRYGSVFMSIITNFYSADYIKLARISEDGSIDTFFETDYNVIPVEERMHHWYYVTDDPELLAEGKRIETIKPANEDWVIEYIKCDEIRKISDESNWNRELTNGWDLCAVTDNYYADKLVCVSSEFCGALRYAQPYVKSYYYDEDGLHIGKVKESGADYIFGDIFPAKWDFTDPSKKDLYVTIDQEGFVTSLLIFPALKKPEAFLNANAGILSASDLDSLIREADAASEKEDSEYTVYSYDNYKGNEHQYVIFKNGIPNTRGVVAVFSIDGQKYLAEFVISCASFEEFYSPFLITFGIILLVLCLAIALILAVRPYSQYKKAYENNNFKNNLIDSLAHNMKTPLQILGGYAENLKDVETGEEKDRYADQILAKTAEMNKDIEAILKTAEKSDRKFVKASVRTALAEAAEKAGAEVVIKGDTDIKMDRDYFKTALFCLIDNASKYKTADSKIEADITGKGIKITNKTDAAKYTPGTGLAIAGRILEQHRLYLKTQLKDGVFEALITKKPAGK
ncbi:MAG: HAMP domain-containing histidine kinase [Clostridiales bacterium]|nr:HAMP domain-containing histidine kinase [Clostridiales bacterium]